MSSRSRPLASHKTRAGHRARAYSGGGGVSGVCGYGRPPAPFHPYGEGWRAVALGTQRGAVSSKGAVEPIIGFGLGRDDHFSAAQALADAGASPWAEAASADYDLRFAAAELVRWRKQLRCRRQATSRAVAELSN